MFAAQARLDNREELEAALQCAPSLKAGLTDSELLRRVHERWGEAGVARCVGAFAFAAWDAKTRELTLGRDCLGHRGVFYHRGRAFIAFASNIGALLSLPDVPRQIDEMAVANFLAANLTTSDHTYYRDISRVLSRTMTTLGPAGVRHRHYWSPPLDAAPPYRREEDFVLRARELLDQAVAATTSDTPRIALTMSGGLDSSSIAATAAKLGRAQSITSYTIVPPPEVRIDRGAQWYLDESDKIEALARMYPQLRTRLIAQQSLHPVEEDDTRYFARANAPVLGPANFGTFGFMYDAAVADGHKVIQMGHYGNFGLSWAGSHSLVVLLQGGHLRSFAHDLRVIARQRGASLPWTFASEVAARVGPLWMRATLQRLRGRDPTSVARHSALNPTFVADHDLQRLWREQGFDPLFGVPRESPARHRARFLFDFNQNARDTTAMFDKSHGLVMREPLADRRLLEFVLTVPETMFRRGGVARSFARAVLADRLPPTILQERRRGTQTADWFRRLDLRRNQVATDIERLEASPLARRLIDLPRLRRLLQEWPKDEQTAENRMYEYRVALTRGLHVGRFIRWVEGGNA